VAHTGKQKQAALRHIS